MQPGFRFVRDEQRLFCDRFGLPFLFLARGQLCARLTPSVKLALRKLEQLPQP